MENRDEERREGKALLSLEQLAAAAETQGRNYAAHAELERALQATQSGLEAAAQRNFMGRDDRGRFIAMLSDRLRSRAPFSLLRMGDGEGNLLFWMMHRESHPELAEFCIRKILRLMCGRRAPDASQWEAIGAALSHAFSNASLIGLPTLSQFQQSHEKLRSAPDPDTRGASGVLATWDWLGRQDRAWWAHPERVYTIWHVHKWMMESMASLMQINGQVSLITCYADLLEKMAPSFQVQPGETFTIPPQASNLAKSRRGKREGQTPLHYPGVYRQIMEKLGSQDRTGQVFLVGAGVFGKSYCEAVRSAGGMAIDVGSMMDVWSGVGARAYQNEDYVSRHMLQG